MKIRMKDTVLCAAAAVVLGLAAIGGAASAAADVQATGGAGTAVDTDGTQGELKPAVQGTQDSDGDQDAFIIGSEMAVPQTRAGSNAN